MMSSEQEPHDQHRYNWLSFNNDTFYFYLKAVQFYEALLNEDISAIESEQDLAFLLGEKERSELEIHQERNRVVRVQTWLEHEIESQGAQYKKSVLDLMTRQRKEKKIYAYQTKLPFGKVNEDVEFYMVEEGKEEETLRGLMR